MVFCPIQHILEALQVYHSFREDRHRSSYLIVHQYGGCFLFSFVISKVMTSHENALYMIEWLKERGGGLKPFMTWLGGSGDQLQITHRCWLGCSTPPLSKTPDVHMIEFEQYNKLNFKLSACNTIQSRPGNKAN